MGAGRLRVLVITPDFPPANGGIQDLSHRIASAFATLEPTVVTLGHSEAAAFDERQEFRIVRTRASGGPRSLAMLALNATALSVARRERPDVVLSTHIVAAPAAALLRRWLGIPFMQYVYEMELGARPRLARFALARADRVAAVSRYTQDLAVTAGANPDRVIVVHPGVDMPAAPRAERHHDGPPTVLTITSRGRLRVIYNPIDLARFDRSKIERGGMRTLLALPDDAFVLAVISQITPWKGQLEAVQALGRLRRSGHDAYLLIVGEPKFVSTATRYDNRAYYIELGRSIVAEGVKGRVHLLGERSDVEMVMGTLDALLVPSWEEPFGRVVVEAMALGLPVLATNVGGPSEIITDGVDGLLLAPGDPELWTGAIARLMGSPDLRASLGKAAMQRARDFGLPAYVAAMCDIYEEAAHTGRSSPATA